MEGPPKPESPANDKESIMSFEDQLSLAKNLSDAVNARNEFTEGFGGFDTFAEAGQHVDNNREKYDQLEDAVNRLRAEFDERVSDKKEFVDRARSAGNDALADRIARMFHVREKKDSLFSRILRRE